MCMMEELGLCSLVNLLAWRTYTSLAQKYRWGLVDFGVSLTHPPRDAEWWLDVQVWSSRGGMLVVDTVGC